MRLTLKMYIVSVKPIRKTDSECLYNFQHMNSMHNHNIPNMNNTSKINGMNNVRYIQNIDNIDNVNHFIQINNNIYNKFARLKVYKNNSPNHTNNIQNNNIQCIKKPNGMNTNANRINAASNASNLHNIHSLHNIIIFRRSILLIPHPKRTPRCQDLTCAKGARHVQDGATRSYCEPY